MSTLSNIYYTLCKQGYCSDKGSVHSYIEFYEQIFAPHRGAKNVLEIGLFNGHSLRMWEQYFTQAQVHGIDCSETPHDGMADLRPMIASGEHNIHIFDATNADEVKRRFDCVKFDVIIEDAGHDIDQQIDLYNVYKHYMADGGIYIIEDVQAIEEARRSFENIDPEKTVTIVDRRSIKGRYDDTLCIITDKNT